MDCPNKSCKYYKKRKKRTISWELICLVAVIALKDIARNSSVGKESRCMNGRYQARKTAHEEALRSE